MVVELETPDGLGDDGVFPGEPGQEVVVSEQGVEGPNLLLSELLLRENLSNIGEFT